MARAVVNWIVGVASVIVIALTVFPGEEDEGDDGLACTARGCDSGVYVDMSDVPYADENVATVKVCAAGRCETTSRESDLIPIPLSSKGRVNVRVTSAFFDATGRALASDERVVRRKRIFPNGERCGGACLNAAIDLSPDGRLLTRSRYRTPSRNGGPRADLVGAGQVSRATAAAPTGSVLRVAPLEDVQIRTDARSRVRVRGAEQVVKLDDHGRVWLTHIPERATELIVRLDRRRDGRTAEFRFPIAAGP